MYSKIYKDNEEKYLEILRKSAYYKSLLDFEKINSLIIQKSLNLLKKRLDSLNNQIIFDNASRILPILISPGIDTSLLYYLIKNTWQNRKIIYIPNPPVDVRIFYHIYTCLIEELGAEFLEEIPVTISPNIEEDDKSLEMIKFISEYTNNIFIFYFDEIDLPYKSYGEFAQRKILESIKKLHYDVKNLIIAIICSKDSWSIITDIAGSTISSILETELELKSFNINDCKKFVANSMERYWEKNKLNPPLNPFFPLNEKLIEIFYHETKGNHRKFLKLCIKFIEKIVLEEISLENLI